MAESIDTKVIQVSNVAPAASKEQMKILFGFIGRIDEVKLYPPESSETQVTARVCYVKFEDYVSTGVALHLSNTVFIDRALIVVPVMDGQIPDEETALQLAPSAVAGMMPGQPSWPSNVISQLTNMNGTQMITTYDPRLTALGLCQYPPLAGTTDPSKIEEIRRTVYVGNLDSSVNPDHLMKFFTQVGEIKYIRMAGEENAILKQAYIEFTDQRNVATALTYNGVMFQDNPIKVLHSTVHIQKPLVKTQEACQREIEEAMKKVKEAQSLISAALDYSDVKERSSRSRSRSKSRKRHSHSRSRSRKRSSSKSKKRSRSRSRKRSHSRSRRSHSKRRSHSRKRSRSPSKTRKKPAPKLPGALNMALKLGIGSRRSRSRKRSRSRPRSKRSRSRSKRSRSRTKRSRSRTKRSLSRTKRSLSRTKRSLSRSRKKSKTPPKAYITRRSRSRSHRRSRSRSKKRSKTPERKSRSKSLSPPKLEREGSYPPKDTDHAGEKSISPSKEVAEDGPSQQSDEKLMVKSPPQQIDEKPADLEESPTKPVDAGESEQLLSPTKTVGEKRKEPKLSSPPPQPQPQSTETRSRKNSSPTKTGAAYNVPKKASSPTKTGAAYNVPKKARSSSRSPSKSPRRPSRRSRSGSKSRRSGKRIRRSRSRSKKRSRSRSGSRHRLAIADRSKRDRKRERTRSRERDRERERERDRDRERERDRDRDRDRKRDRDKERERDRDREKSRKKHRDRDRDRDKDKDKDKDKEEKRKETIVRRDYDEEEKGYSSGPDLKKTETNEDASYFNTSVADSSSFDASLTADGSNLQQLDMDMSD